MLKRIRQILLPLILCSATAAVAQQPPVNSSLLDHLVGKWVLEGSIAGKDTIHDVTAEWVLEHHYVRIQEVSRMKNGKGEPQYQATIYIGWNEATKEYACVWLDVYGGLATESIGVASQNENELPFVFKDGKGAVTFNNDFVYDAKANTWEWRMDNVANGLAKPIRTRETHPQLILEQFVGDVAIYVRANTLDRLDQVRNEIKKTARDVVSASAPPTPAPYQNQLVSSGKQGNGRPVETRTRDRYCVNVA